MKRRLRSTACVALAVCLLGLGTAPSPAAATGATHDSTGSVGHQPRTPLRHLVLMLQQGHTFDNYFGTRPQVDGLSEPTCLAPQAHGQCVSPYLLHGAPHVALLDTAGAQQVAEDGGRMDGFVRAQAVHGADARVAMGHYDAASLPVLDQLADRGAVFDHWFSGVAGGPVANDLFAVAGAAPLSANAVPSRGWGGVPMIFDRLQAAGVPWRVYVEDYRPGLTIHDVAPGELRTGQVARVPLLAADRFLRGDILANHVAPLGRYYADLAHGSLPAVSFVVTTRHTERPPRNPAIDQQVVRSVANALIASTAWAHAAFLLSYDSAGGWYDHVRPPTVDGTRLGLRVPAVLLSPYVLPGSVIPRRYDAAAPLRLIEQNWGLAPLTARDRTATSLLPVFSFSGIPGRAALVDVHPSRPPVVQPDSRILYGGYLSALVVALCCIVVIATRDDNRLRGRS